MVLRYSRGDHSVLRVCGRERDGDSMHRIHHMIVSLGREAVEP